MSDFAKLIPKEKPLKFFGGRTPSQVWADERAENLERQRERRQLIPPARRSIVVASWTCIPGWVEEATRYSPRREFAGFCTVPPGFRCSRCGNGYQDHDPGDEG